MSHLITNNNTNKDFFFIFFLYKNNTDYNRKNNNTISLFIKYNDCFYYLTASDCAVNLFVLVDSSSSIDYASWKQQSEFIIKFLNVLDSGVKVSFSTYNDGITKSYENRNIHEIIDVIGNTFTEEGVTDTTSALKYMDELINYNTYAHSTIFFSESSKRFVPNVKTF